MALEPGPYCDTALPSLKLRISCVTETSVHLHRDSSSSARRRCVLAVRVLESLLPPSSASLKLSTKTHQQKQDILVTVEAHEDHAVVSGHPLFLPGAVALLDVRELHNGEESSCTYYADDGMPPSRSQSRLGREQVAVQFAPSVEWHRLCTLGETEAVVNWVQPPLPMTPDGLQKHCPLTWALLAHVPLVRNTRDCDEVEVVVTRHPTEATNQGAVKVRVMTQGVECFKSTFPRKTTSAVLSPLAPMDVYSVFIKGIYHTQDGPHSLDDARKTFGVASTGRWFVTLAPEVITIEAPTENLVRLHKQRHVLPEIALEDFGRRMRSIRRWEPYSFDIPPSTVQMVSIKASWADNEHLRAQRQEEIEGIDELLDLTRAYHVIERWRKMIRKVKRERRNFRRRLSSEKLDLEASYASVISRANSDGGGHVGTAQTLDDAAFARRKTEVSFLVAFQKSRREKLRTIMGSNFLLEQEMALPDRWTQFDMPDLPAQAMFRVVVSEYDGTPSLSSAIAMGDSRNPSSMTLHSTKWKTLVTLPVLTKVDAGSGGSGVQQHSASFLKELLRLQVSKHLMVEHISDRTLTLSWSPVDFDKVAQLVYELQSSSSSSARSTSPAVRIQGHGTPEPSSQTPQATALADQSVFRLQELHALREDIKRAQQLEDKRIQFEYALLLTPVDDKTTLKFQQEDVTGSIDLRIPTAPGERTNEDSPGTGGGTGSVISVFLSGFAFAPNNSPSPFEGYDINPLVPPPREERLRTYQHHYHITNLIPNQKYLIQLCQYNVLEGRWYDPSPPLLTCTASPSSITVSDFPATGELNASATCTVSEGLLGQLESTAKKTVYGTMILPRHAFSYSNCSLLEIRLYRVRSGTGEPQSPTIVTTRSCALKDASKGVSFRSLDPNAMYKVTCRRVTTIPGRFGVQPTNAAVAALEQQSPRRSRSASKLAEALTARNEAMSVTYFTVRCLPVYLTDIETTGLNVRIKKRWFPEMDLLQPGAESRSSFATSRSLGSGEVGSASPTHSNTSSYNVPLAFIQQASGPFGGAFGSAPSDDSNDVENPDDDPSAEYAILSQGFGVVLLSNTSDSNVVNFDPLGLTDWTLRVDTDGFDRIVVMACVGRCYGSNEDAALEDFELMWPRMSIALSLVVDWSLLPFAVRDDAIEMLLTPVQCTPDLNWTSWDDDSEERVAEYQEVGKHLKRLIEAREENNAQFQGLHAEVQCIEGNFPAEEPIVEASGHARRNRRRSSQAVTRSSSEKNFTRPRSNRIACSGRPVIISDLKPDTIYTVRIRPVMGGGAAGRESFGAWSPEVKLRTAAPLTLDVEGIEDSSVALKWYRSSPHPDQIISQLLSYSIPQPTAHPNFVTSVTEFVCFLYRHVIYGSFVVWRREVGPEGVDVSGNGVPDDVVPGSQHHQVRDLPQGVLYIIRVQQRSALGMVGDASGGPARHDGEGEDEQRRQSQHGIELRVQSPDDSGSDDGKSSQSGALGIDPAHDSDVDQSFDGPPPSTTDGSWSSTTVCVRTIGELKAHINPLGSDRFQVIVARPGFEDDKYNGTIDERGREIVVHRPKVQPLIFVQARVLSGFHPGRMRGLVEATDDADLVPSYPSVITDGAAYWAAFDAANPAALYWTDRSGLTDHRMPFYDNTNDIDVSTMREVKQVVGARGTLLPPYHVINLMPNATMSYVLKGLPRGKCHQVQVRSRCYPSMERVPSAGVDLRATAGTILSPWSQPVLMVTFHAPRLRIGATTESTAAVHWVPPERPEYSPPGTEQLTRVEIEIIGFTSGVDESYAPGTAGVNDAEDTPHRPRARKFVRSCTTSQSPSRSNTPLIQEDAADSSETVLVDRLLPGGIVVAVATGFFGDLRGPTSPLHVFHTVCPVVVTLTGLSAFYCSVLAYRRTPFWKECIGGLEHFIRCFPKRVDLLTESVWASTESQETVRSAQRASLPPAATSTPDHVDGAQQQQAGGGGVERETFDIELCGVSKNMEALPVSQALVLPIAHHGHDSSDELGSTREAANGGSFFVTQLQPTTLYRVRARATATPSGAADGTTMAWSRATYFATLGELLLTLAASYETQSVFTVTRRPPLDSTIPTWARRDVDKSLVVAKTAEWIELGLRELRPGQLSHGGVTAVSTSVVRRAIATELALNVTNLQSGCTYRVVSRALPTAAGELQEWDAAMDSCQSFAWRDLGTVVTCPFAPTIPSLYEARGGQTLGFFWGYDAKEAHLVGSTLKQLPLAQVLTPDDVPEDIRARMLRGRVASIHCTPPSDRRTSDQHLQHLSATMPCPDDYPLTPYSATNMTFSIEAIVLEDGRPVRMDDGDGLQSPNPIRHVRRKMLIGSVTEAFARLEFALPHQALAQSLRLRVKAVASVHEANRDVESEWSPSFTFAPPPTPLGPPKHLRLVESLGNRAIIAWDAPDVAGHFQCRFQVSMLRPGGGTWRDAVWVTGATTQCIVHGLMAKEPHKIRVVAHSTFAPLEGVASSALCMTPFSKGRGLTADTGAEETTASLQSTISALLQAQCTYPCPIRDDLHEGEQWTMLSQPSLHHAESRAAAARAGLTARRADTLRVGEDVISEVLSRGLVGGQRTAPMAPKQPPAGPTGAAAARQRISTARPAIAQQPAARPMRPSSAAPVQARRHPGLPKLDLFM